MENQKKVMLSGIQPSGELHLGNYLGAIKNWGARADEFDCFYFMADMHTITVRPGGAPPPHSGAGGPVHRLRSGPGAQHNFCPVPRAPARGAGLGAGVLHHVRRAVPHDPVQGQIRQARRQHQRRPVYLPLPDGGGHPALPAGLCAGGGGSEAARGADPQRGPALQPRVRRRAQGARALHPQDGRAGDEPEPAGHQDEQIHPRGLRVPDG